MTRDEIPDQWADAANCATTDPDLFTPEKGGSARAAKAVCAACDVAAECLQSALDNNIRTGIYGGLTSRERAPLHRAHNAGKPRAPKTECKWGHDWTVPANVKVRGDGARYCLACQRDRQQRRAAA